MGEGKEEVGLTTVPLLKSQYLSLAPRVHTAGSVTALNAQEAREPLPFRWSQAYYSSGF